MVLYNDDVIMQDVNMADVVVIDSDSDDESPRISDDAEHKRMQMLEADIWAAHDPQTVSQGYHNAPELDGKDPAWTADPAVNPFTCSEVDSTVVGETSSDNEEEDLQQKPDGMTDEQFRAACHDLVGDTLASMFPKVDPLDDPFIDFGVDEWEPICRNDDNGVTLSFIMVRNQTKRIHIRRQEITDTLHEFANRYPLDWFDRDLKRGFELCGGGVRFRFHTT
jgi:hypothetical protein